MDGIYLIELCKSHTKLCFIQFLIDHALFLCVCSGEPLVESSSLFPYLRSKCRDYHSGVFFAKENAQRGAEIRKQFDYLKINM